MGGLIAFSPEKIISSTASRCLATVAPLAQASGLPIKQESAISQEAYEHGDDDPLTVVTKTLKRKQTVVLCSHGPVIPELIDHLVASVEPAQPPAYPRAELATGDYTVLHVSRKKKPRLVAVETHKPPV